MTYLGDYLVGTTVDFKWSTNDADGASITRSTNGTISVYKSNSLTQRTAGIADTEDFDSLIGVHHCAINTTDGFYVANTDYQVVLSASIINAQTVNAVIGQFSIENRSSSLDTTSLANLITSLTNYSATRGLSGTALPAVAAGSAGGLPDDTDANGAVRIVDGTGAREINTNSGAIALVDLVTTTTTNTDMVGTDSALLAASVNVSGGIVESNLIEMGGVTQSATDLKDFADAGYDPVTNKVEGVKLVDTLTTYTGNTLQTGDSYVVVNSGTFGNAQLVRSTTPANALDVNATGEAGIDLDNTSGTLAKTTAITGFNDIAATAIVSAGAIVTLSGAVVNVDTVDTITTYTGNTVQTGDSYTRIGHAGVGLTHLAESSICTETRLTELDSANIPSDIDSIVIGTITNAQGVDVATDVAGMIDGNSRVDVGSWLGTAVTLGSGAPDVNIASTDDIDLTTTQKASVNTEVDTALVTTTYGEPGQGAPSATASIKDKLSYMYKFARNKLTNDGINVRVWDDAGTTIDQLSPVSSVGGTVTRGEFITGA